MAYYHDNDITRDGFTCSYGRFHALPGDVERVEGSSLRSMFLPTLNPKGRKLINACHSDHFVRGQLKHYGVQWNESEISGNGTRLIKKILQAGKCDKVPDHIFKLREQMHTEWLNRLTPEQLSDYPEWVMDRYFLSSGQQDRTKMTTVVGIPFDRYNSYRVGQMREATSKVAGLHQEAGLGPKTQTIFMGWDSIAVSKAAKGHAAKEAKELQAAKDERENERVALHTDYLNNLKRKKAFKASQAYSPVGSYIINCKEIEEQWPDQADDLSLDIRETEEPGVFDVSFDFGVLEGVMIISAEENTLERYCSQLDREGREAESDWDENWSGRESEEEDEEKFANDDENGGEVGDNKKPITGSKRKAEAPRGRGRPPKKSKPGPAQPDTYLLRLKCRETGEGQIYDTAEEGTIRFEDESLVSFIGKADLPCVGQGVPFTARKKSDAPTCPGNTWAEYSDSVYGYARVGRWH
ncbi:hypothetical protein D0Z07_5989 [Hyphodiscus hymeniophilus]|uniref:Uncharacterized protein n=1 Tax=Hyphodiscus hymeniophilus TaxID=353542 RepID=A0A9P7AWH4_9HELO|nr:hypothetical protein D0Z07_5989 [Hyphodiscus hymeniophilus]